MARIEDRNPFRARRNSEKAIRRKRLLPGEPERPDILLDAPQLEAKNLALEIEDLELANLIRIGKVRLEVESLDAELFLQTHLEDLLHTLDRLASTVDFGLSLVFAPAYNFNRATAAWYDTWYENLVLARRWFELPIRIAEGYSRPEVPPARRASPVPVRAGSRPANSHLANSLEDYQAVRHIVSADGDVIATVVNEDGQVVGEEVVGRLRLLPQETLGEGGETGPPKSPAESG